MALFDSNTRAGSSIGGFMPGYFGGTPIGGSKGESNAKMLSPNLEDAYQGFQKLQPGLMSNQLQQDAVGEQQGLRGRLSNLLDQQGQGERMRIDDAFQTAANNATGGLASRGFAGSSLNIPAQLGVERERNMAHAQLNDSLLGRRMGMESDVSKNISDLLFGSSEQATNLQAALLGAQGIGNFSQSATENNPPSGGGSSGGSKSSSGPTARESFDQWRQQFQQPGFREQGGGSGGGGASGGGGGGGQPQAYMNPFMALEGGPPPAWESDEERDEIAGQELVQDQGPQNTPELFAKNKAILDAREAQTNAALQQMNQAAPQNATGGLTGDLGGFGTGTGAGQAGWGIA